MLGDGSSPKLNGVESLSAWVESQSPERVIVGVGEDGEAFSGLRTPVAPGDLLRSRSEARRELGVVPGTELERAAASVQVEVVGFFNGVCGVRQDWRKPAALKSDFGASLLNGRKVRRDEIWVARCEHQSRYDCETAHGKWSSVYESEH